ncbi:MAG TPA: DMT family transporter [Bauldia sp.]|nr:DMT family transporter [Bauldia sp.]
MHKLPYVLAAIAFGGLIALQPGLNADVARRIGTPFGAAFVSTSVAMVCAVAYMAIIRPPLSVAGLTGMPWHLWLAGVIGFGFVVGALWLAPILGGAALFASLVAGQMLMAIAADHFGFGGYREHAVDLWRIGGLVLVVAGVWMFQQSG